MFLPSLAVTSSLDFLYNLDTMDSRSGLSGTNHAHVTLQPFFHQQDFRSPCGAVYEFHLQCRCNCLFHRAGLCCLTAKAILGHLWYSNTCQELELPLRLPRGLGNALPARQRQSRLLAATSLSSMELCRIQLPLAISGSNRLRRASFAVYCSFLLHLPLNVSNASDLRFPGSHVNLIFVASFQPFTIAAASKWSTQLVQFVSPE